MDPSSHQGSASAQPSPRPVLITGAAGFIGGRLARALRREGVPVRALVRPEHDAQDLDAGGVEVTRGDVTDRDAVADAASGCRVIYHLAAARGRHKLSYRAFMTENSRLSQAVGEAALEAGVDRVVMSSAATVTGHPGPEKQTEETPTRPNSSYRASRLGSERALEEFGRTGCLEVVIARVPTRVMGPGARDWARLVRSVGAGTVRALPAGGTIHSGDVDDIIDGLRRCARCPGVGGERFLLGGPAPTRIIDVLRAIADRLGVAFTPRIVPGAPVRAYVALGNLVFRATHLSLPHHYTAEFFSSRMALDLSKAQRELGYSPRFEMRESVERTVAWLRASDLI